MGRPVLYQSQGSEKMNHKEGFSFIIPVYNARTDIENTLKKLYSSIERARLSSFEVIVVDDGSTDSTSEVIASLNHPHLRILRQENSGRLLARRSGLEASIHESLFFLDSRVELSESAIDNLLSSREKNKKGLGVIIPKIIFAKTNLVGLFWDSIAQIVWSEYYKSDCDVILTDANFDDYPKGTTFLYAKKSLMLEAYANLTAAQLENKDTNDDTLIIRFLAKKTLILLNKSAIAMYTPRFHFFDFLRHAHHRGKVAGEGFFAPGTKGRKLFYLTGVLLVAMLSLSLLFPFTLLALFLIFAMFEVFVFKNVTIRHFLSLNIYALPFLSSYIMGVIWATSNRMWKI
jgi:glycosyltransferase involved in cell wall biosynthesis